MNQSLIKLNARKRFKLYGLAISLVLLGCAVFSGSLIVGAIAVISLAIHVVSEK